MLRRVILLLILIISVILNGCTNTDLTSAVSGDSASESKDTEEKTGIQLLRFETADLAGLGNSISNLSSLGLIAGDNKQLYTLEYWELDSGDKRAGMQIYVSDAAGRRCLTNENDIVGYLNLTDSAVYYVNSSGISMIDRSSETVQEVVSVKNVSGLLLVKSKLYFIASDALYSFDLDTQRQTEIAPSVMRGYLDFAENQLFFCTGTDMEKRESSLCVLKADGGIETLYSFNTLQLQPVKMLDVDTLICASVVKENPTGPDRYNLILLNMRENTQRILVSNYSPASFALNGDQLIAGSGGYQIETYWLIDLKEGSVYKLPNWGVGALNFAADRLFAVNVMDVTCKELIRKNDQFYAEPMP